MNAIESIYLLARAAQRFQKGHEPKFSSFLQRLFDFAESRGNIGSDTHSRISNRLFRPIRVQIQQLFA
jgi:hypothetical protein